MHLPWMSQPKNQKYVQQFMDYATSKPDVWVSSLLAGWQCWLVGQFDGLRLDVELVDGL